MGQIRNDEKRKKLEDQTLCICKFSLVREIDVRWNQIEFSVLVVAQKLVNLQYNGGVSRLPSKGRLPAQGRIPASNRKPLGFINDGRIHAVLDTNVPINALWALSKGENATQTEKNCLSIIELVKGKKITIGIHDRLLSEYRKIAQRYLATGKFRPEDVTYVMNIVSDGDNQAAFRVRVDPMRFSPDPDDDMLFDGPAADFLVSDNLKHVKPERLLPGVSPHTKTLSPTSFITLINGEEPFST